MIQLIGMQRIIVLVTLLVINAMIGVSWYFVIEPRTVEAKREKNLHEAEIRKMRSELSDIEGKLKTYHENEKVFEALQDRGLFGGQDRLMARRVLKEIQGDTRMATIDFSIGKAEFPANPVAKSINKNIMKSRVEVDLTAYIDSDCYAFVDRVNRDFPGHTRIVKFEIEPTRKPVKTRDIIELSRGQNINFVRAKLEFDWFTLYDGPVVEQGQN